MIKNPEKLLARAFDRTVNLIYDEIREKCPVRTGKLKRSIACRIKNGRGEIKTDVEYAAAVEFGAAGRRPNPFMKNGLSAARIMVADIYREEILNG